MGQGDCPHRVALPGMQMSICQGPQGHGSGHLAPLDDPGTGSKPTGKENPWEQSPWTLCQASEMSQC